MKLVIKSIIATGATAAFTLGLLYVVAGDRFMPWVPEEAVYVSTTQAEGVPECPGGYTYTANYISQTGKQGRITFYAPGQLRTGSFLKLDAKGNYVARLEEVEEEDLPAAAIGSL